MSIAAPVFAARYISAICVAAILYDHALTLRGEICHIWLNSAAGIGNRIGFLVNRYMSESIIIYVAYMDSGESRGITDQLQCIRLDIHHRLHSIRSGIPLFIIVVRIYTLWDRRQQIKWILGIAFGVAISISFSFSVLSAQQIQSFVEYNTGIHMSFFQQQPQTGFDLFIIIMTVINALDRPYQKQAEVMTSLQHDGARMFVCLFLLRLTSLIMSIVGDSKYFYVTLIIGWAMCSIVNSRIQLRIEGLRFIRFTGVSDTSTFELYSL
ncbi:hypothetical protein B0H11DRAFT_270875 [Mycena galericulata]|nr:hypothetical protein B0H11DRAFT_270875 [Mycena galericulata]